MNKTDLVKKIAAAAEISQAQAKVALEATTAAIQEALVAGDSVQLIGFGTFAVKDVPARTGKNPRTGEVINIPAKKAPKFKAGAALVEAVK